jgi:PAS domain-containing protein
MKKLLEFASLQKADPALAVTLKFVIVGIAWILFSDSFLFFLGSENIIWKLTHIHILKGLLFVGVTGGFLFFWTNRYVQSLHEREVEVKNLFQSSPIAMGIMDAHTLKFLEINHSLITLFELSGKQLKDLILSDLAEEQERFEAVPLLIKTGNRELGAWKFKKGERRLSVELCAQPIRNKTAYLIIFTDVTNQLRNARDMEAMRLSIEHRMNEQIVNLHRMNEELAYRASQTEHVNSELISVNEQLQHVNKKIALRAEDFFLKNEQMNGVLSTLSDVFWSFDLTGRSKSYISPSAETLYDEPCETLCRPWFWLDFIHPDDAVVKQNSQQQLMETGSSSITCRILTRNGQTKWIFSRMKLLHDPKGIPLIVGCAIDVTETRNTPDNIISSDSTVIH